MKRITICLMMAVALLAFSPLYALDYIVGAKGGYFYWEPVTKQFNVAGFQDIDRGSGALYGPIFSVILTPDLSLAVSGLMGEQGTDWQTSHKLNERGQYVSGNYAFTAKRYDLDSALSYRLGESLKIFAGYKYQYLKSSFKTTNMRVEGTALKEIEFQDLTIKQPAHGPALGLGFSMPLGKGYFFAINLSGLYMRGRFDMSSNESFGYYSSNSFASPNYQSDISQKLKTTQYGANLEPSLGVNMGEGMPIVTLGVRYQWMKLKFKDAPTNQGFPSKYVDDKVYGVFVGMMYQL